MSVRKAVLGIIAAGGVAYGGTVAYLTHFDHATAPAPAGAGVDAVSANALNVVREARCDYCHAANVSLPFYFSLPVAKVCGDSQRA
ncbi:heme-binding domain-containing protein [Komagataeibacter medellinensis]|uniref:heme-binding domain-containing protein n=1 Tax=Komagataeibacter medellinensis TaxID=1177712 RepID=UPI002B1EC6F0|nr:heme-binding domain-containing protein [Komagataeibacter medellinensis]